MIKKSIVTYTIFLLVFFLNIVFVQSTSQQFSNNFNTIEFKNDEKKDFIVVFNEVGALEYRNKNFDENKLSSQDFSKEIDSYFNQHNENIKDVSNYINKNKLSSQAIRNNKDNNGIYVNIFSGMTISNIGEKEYNELVDEFPNFKFYEDEVYQLNISSFRTINSNGKSSIIGSISNHIVPENTNLTGRGVKVAVIDSGIEINHSDFGNCNDSSFLNNTCDKIITGYDYVDNDNIPNDLNGAGTHVSSIISSNNSNSNFTGIAPESKLMIYKVISESGTVIASNVLDAIEDITNLSENDKPDVAYIYAPFSQNNPNSQLSEAVDELVDLNIVVVAGVGKDNNENSIRDPASSRKIIAVGSTNSDGENESNIINEIPYSKNSLGPTSIGTIKPDILAPGVDICAALLSYDSLGISTCENSNEHTELSSSTTSASIIAGISTLLKEKNNSYTASEVKSIFKSTAVDLNYSPIKQGFGRVNISKALNSQIPCQVEFNTSNFESIYTFENELNINASIACPNFQNYTLSFNTLTYNTTTNDFDLNKINEINGFVQNHVTLTVNTTNLSYKRYFLELNVYDNNKSLNSKDHLIVDKRLDTNPGNTYHCGIINQSGVYNVLNNISQNSFYGSQYCFEIEADNVVINCNKYTISGRGDDQDEMFVFAKDSYQNLTINNCNTKEISFSLYFQEDYNGIVSINNSNFINGDELIYTDAQTQFIVFNSMFKNSNGGFYIDGIEESRLIIVNSTFSNISEMIILDRVEIYNLSINNSIFINSPKGIKIDDSSEIEFKSQNMSFININQSLLFVEVDELDINSNKSVFFNTYFPIVLNNSADGEINFSNIFFNNTKFDIFFEDSSDFIVRFENITFLDSKQDSRNIQITGGTDSILNFSTITFNSLFDIKIDDVESIVFNNTYVLDYQDESSRYKLIESNFINLTQFSTLEIINSSFVSNIIPIEDISFKGGFGVGDVNVNIVNSNFTYLDIKDNYFTIDNTSIDLIVISDINENKTIEINDSVINSIESQETICSRYSRIVLTNVVTSNNSQHQFVISTSNEKLDFNTSQIGSLIICGSENVSISNITITGGVSLLNSLGKVTINDSTIYNSIKVLSNREEVDFNNLNIENKLFTTPNNFGLFTDEIENFMFKNSNISYFSKSLNITEGENVELINLKINEAFDEQIYFDNIIDLIFINNSIVTNNNSKNNFNSFFYLNGISGSSNISNINFIQNYSIDNESLFSCDLECSIIILNEVEDTYLSNISFVYSYLKNSHFIQVENSILLDFTFENSNQIISNNSINLSDIINISFSDFTFKNINQNISFNDEVSDSIFNGFISENNSMYLVFEKKVDIFENQLFANSLNESLIFIKNESAFSNTYFNTTRNEIYIGNVWITDTKCSEYIFESGYKICLNSRNITLGSGFTFTDLGVLRETGKENNFSSLVQNSTLNVSSKALNFNLNFNKEIDTLILQHNISGNITEYDFTDFLSNDKQSISEYMPLNFGKNNIIFIITPQNESVEKYHSSFILNLDIISGINDSDNDTISNSLDEIFGKGVNIGSNIDNLTIFVNGSSNISKVFNNSFNVGIKSIKNANRTIVEFTNNFSTNHINATQIILREKVKDNKSQIIISGLDLEVNKTKILYLNLTGDINKFRSICIRDNQISDFTDITANCSGLNETYVHNISSYNSNNELNSTYNISFYNSSTLVQIIGLKNSGISQICTENWAYSSWSSCVNNIQTRTANDSNNCGTTFTREDLSQSCTSTPSNSGGGGGGGSSRSRTQANSNDIDFEISNTILNQSSNSNEEISNLLSILDNRDYKIIIDSIEIIEEQEFKGLVEIELVNNYSRIVFIHNFSKSDLNLSNLTYIESIGNMNNSRNSVLVNNLELQENQSKTIYLQKSIEHSTVCAKDKEFTSIDNISKNCDGEDEYLLYCSILSLTNEYNCYIKDGYYVIEGLNHSGVIEFESQIVTLEDVKEQIQAFSPYSSMSSLFYFLILAFVMIIFAVLIILLVLRLKEEDKKERTHRVKKTPSTRKTKKPKFEPSPKFEPLVVNSSKPKPELDLKDGLTPRQLIQYKAALKYLEKYSHIHTFEELIEKLKRASYDKVVIKKLQLDED